MPRRERRLTKLEHRLFRRLPVLRFRFRELTSAFDADAYELRPAPVREPVAQPVS